MPSLKKHISECIHVDQSSLNEISLDDVRFDENTLICIRRIVMKMLALYDPLDPAIEQIMFYKKSVPCIGFWVENTKDLILYFTIEKHFKTLIVDKDGWTIRDDITIN
jgi:hypothetical protein